MVMMPMLIILSLPSMSEHQTEKANVDANGVAATNKPACQIFFRLHRKAARPKQRKQAFRCHDPSKICRSLFPSTFIIHNMMRGRLICLQQAAPSVTRIRSGRKEQAGLQRIRRHCLPSFVIFIVVVRCRKYNLILCWQAGRLRLWLLDLLLNEHGLRGSGVPFVGKDPRAPPASACLPASGRSTPIDSDLAVDSHSPRGEFKLKLALAVRNRDSAAQRGQQGRGDICERMGEWANEWMSECKQSRSGRADWLDMRLLEQIFQRPTSILFSPASATGWLRGLTQPPPSTQTWRQSTQLKSTRNLRELAR